MKTNICYFEQVHTYVMNDQKLINKSYLNTPKGAYKIDINPIYT